MIALDIILRFIMVERHVVQKDEHCSDSEVPLDNVRVVSSQALPKSTCQALPKSTCQSPVVHSFHPSLVQSQAEMVDYMNEPVPHRTRLPAIVTLLSSKRLLSALLGTLIEGAIFSGLETVLPLQTQAAFGWQSEGAGLIFIPLTLPSFLGPVVGRMCDKYGPRFPIVIGFLVQCPSLILLRLIDHNTIGQKALLCVLLTLIGCCITLTVDPLMAEIAYSVEEKAKLEPRRYQKANSAYAQAFALFNMAFSVGNTIGPLCAGLVRDAAGWGTMSWTLGLLGGVAAVPTGLWCGGWIWKGDARWRPDKGAERLVRT